MGNILVVKKCKINDCEEQCIRNYCSFHETKRFVVFKTESGEEKVYNQTETIEKLVEHVNELNKRLNNIKQKEEDDGSWNSVNYPKDSTESVNLKEVEYNDSDDSVV